jgi:hypothetical protein
MSNLAVIIAVVVGVFFLGCLNGYSIRDQAAKTAAAKAFKAASDERVKLQGQLDVVSAKYEIERKRASQVAVERYNTVKEYYNNAPAVDPRCALPDRMYGLLAHSVADANVAASGEPSGVVRSASSAIDTGH